MGTAATINKEREEDNIKGAVVKIRRILEDGIYSCYWPFYLLRCKGSSELTRISEDLAIELVTTKLYLLIDLYNIEEEIRKWQK